MVRLWKRKIKRKKNNNTEQRRAHAKSRPNELTSCDRLHALQVAPGRKQVHEIFWRLHRCSHCLTYRLSTVRSPELSKLLRRAQALRA